jgi:phosphoribosylamine-glycine ligase
VLGVTALSESLAEAARIAYDEAEKISFPNLYKRNDIGKVFNQGV